MRAVTWCGKQRLGVDSVPEPQILNPRDAIVKIAATCICGSDLHLYDGFIPTMRRGDILGHEFMGEVVEVGPGVDRSRINVGDRVVVPFTIACGGCWFCRHEYWSLCDNTNPNAWLAEKVMGFTPSGIYGYSHMLGGYAGGQAEYARVPFADVGPLKVPADISDEQAVLLSDILPTAYMAAENCGLQGGEVVAVWGCGPVGQLAIACCFLLGAEKVVAIDSVPERLEMAASRGATPVDMRDEWIYERLLELTGGRGPDACIEAVGHEAHGATLDAWYDQLAVSTYMATDKAHALRQCINCCRKGGVVSVPGVYGGIVDKFPMGPFMNKSLTMRTGQTHMMRYMKPLLERIQKGEIDPSFVITHTVSLDEAPRAYEMFKHKREGCVKVVMKP